MWILTGCTFFSDFCGFEVINETGIILSVIGVGDLDSLDFGCSCSGLFGFSDEDVELFFERRGGGGGGDGDGFLSAFSCLGEGGGVGCLFTFSRLGEGGGVGCF
jgi:hypothetical protein